MGQDFFERVGQTVKTAGDTVVRQAKILEVKSQIRGKLQTLGYAVYKADRNGTEPSLDGTISELNRLYEKLEDLREEGQIP